jgi:hypothetical protein
MVVNVRSYESTTTIPFAVYLPFVQKFCTLRIFSSSMYDSMFTTC